MKKVFLTVIRRWPLCISGALFFVQGIIVGHLGPDRVVQSFVDSVAESVHGPLSADVGDPLPAAALPRADFLPADSVLHTVIVLRGDWSFIQPVVHWYNELPSDSEMDDSTMRFAASDTRDSI